MLIETHDTNMLLNELAILRGQLEQQKQKITQLGAEIANLKEDPHRLIDAETNPRPNVASYNLLGVNP